jgi:hypothetical protein
MDRKAEQYRRKAAAAKAAANVALDEAAKQIYLEKARRLREMADQVEQSCPPNGFPARTARSNPPSQTIGR